MQRKLVLEFTKMTGAGNDFIVIDNRFYYFSDDELAVLAQRFCPRRTGIGADGLLAFGPGEDGADFRMRHLNADGSVSTMCGNGARCLVRFARLAGMTGERLTFDTDAGRYAAEVVADGAVRLFVPPPERYVAAHRLHAPPAESPETVSTIWTGTEHVVVPVASVEAAPLAAWGPAIRNDASLAPRGANVNVVQLAPAAASGEAAVQVRTYERGVEGETLACGTGALAAALAMRLRGATRASRTAVKMPGGTLYVGFHVDDLAAAEVSGVYLEGPADVVYRGTLELSPLT